MSKFLLDKCTPLAEREYNQASESVSFFYAPIGGFALLLISFRPNGQTQSSEPAERRLPEVINHEHIGV